VGECIKPGMTASPATSPVQVGEAKACATIVDPCTASQALPLTLPPDLARTVEMLRLPRGAKLFYRAQPVEKLYFIETGAMAALRTMADGGEAIMLTGRSGEFFGEPSLFVGHYTCEARALADTTLLAWPLEAFRQALRDDPDFSLAFMQHIVTKMRMQCSRVERLRLKHAHERVLHYLTCGADAEGWVSLPGTTKEWAYELGLEPATLYRTLSQVEADGKIVRDKRRIRLTCQAGTHRARVR